MNKEKTSASINMLSTGLNMMAQVVINGLTGYLNLTGNLSIGVFFSIGNFASLIFSELVVLNQNTTMIQSAKDLNNKLLVELKPVNNKENGQNNIANFAKLSIVKLQEHFSNGEVVSYPDITIKSGEKILLSGDSGTGKSTLFKLILGELKPTEGKIIFKDKNGQQIHPDLAKIGYIPQDPTLFPGTIKENITMFNNKLDGEAEEVAKKMQLGTDLKKCLMA